MCVRGGDSGMCGWAWGCGRGLLAWFRCRDWPGLVQVQGLGSEGYLALDGRFCYRICLLG